MNYHELHCISNYSFLRGASHPQELVARAYELGYSSITISDECSLAGIVKAHKIAKTLGIHLIVGSEFRLTNGLKFVAIAPTRKAYSELSGFITLTRRRSEKGSYEAHFQDLRFRLQSCLIIWLAEDTTTTEAQIKDIRKSFQGRLWIGISLQFKPGEQKIFQYWKKISEQHHIPLVACGGILMHEKLRKPLLDTLRAIKENVPIQNLGKKLTRNSEAYLKSLPSIQKIYPSSLILETQTIASHCQFSMDELRYQYPQELVPAHLKPIEHLKVLVKKGEKKRWPKGTPSGPKAILEKELSLIEELHYEYYFLTVYDIVEYARSQDILCQGRGSAANSVVCYCLLITEIAPGQINVLFERFISKERDEPPDIDVDFEHERREEVIQYIYDKYTRQRAALAAAVVTYRSRSAIRDVGKALGLEQSLIDHLAKSLAWWDRTADLIKRIQEAGLHADENTMTMFFMLVNSLLGFPRHLSQHVGGFVITQDKISDLVPVENANMPDRTIIQWDKEDLEAMGLMKVDVLALGMLTALKKSLKYVNSYDKRISGINDIPREDQDTYNMLSRGDSIGVFQVESRAQISMLPRLRPQCFYDLVIEIAIVRPGPIQGDMVHPYLRRRDGLEAITYENDDLKDVLACTKGIPIFQEQAIRLAMVAADFSGGEADQLRRAMASWGKNGNLLQFETKFISGMLNNGYSQDFSNRLFEQIKGFGGYGFPESHSASFALLCYASSWFKCHHPAAFYCALLNSQPMGFYSPSQLLQDAARHGVTIYPVDINISVYDSAIEKVAKEDSDQSEQKSSNSLWGIRLGFRRIKSLSSEKAKMIEQWRENRPFLSITELADRTELDQLDLQILASADTLVSISGHRYLARWSAAAVTPKSHLLPNRITYKEDLLTTQAPTLESEITTDMQTMGHSLKPHPMSLLRHEHPFNRCKTQAQLAKINNGRYVCVAGLVTGRQRPGTAKGTLFLTLEDETGNINIVVWKATQELFRQALLTSKLLMIKGRLETKDSVIHVIAGRLIDHSKRLQGFALKSRDFH